MAEINKFDDYLRDALSNLGEDVSPGDWDSFAEKLSEALDLLATDNLSNLYVPYNPTHWTLLSHRLEEELNVRRKIVTYKLVEFSLMALLLLTIVQFMPNYSNISAKDKSIAEAQACHYG